MFRSSYDAVLAQPPVTMPRPPRQPRPDELPTREEMDRLIRRETSRADRNGHEFSVVFFHVYDRRTARSTCRLVREIQHRARNTDEVGWFGDDYLCVALPDTPAAGARVFAESVCARVAPRMPRPCATVYSYPGDWVAAGGETDGCEEATAAYSDRNVNGNGNGHGDHGDPVMRGLVGDPALAGRPGVGIKELRPLLSDAIAHALRGPGPWSLARSLSQPLPRLLVRPMPKWKRALDIAGTLLLLLALSPVMAAAVAAIRLSSRGPVIFRQKRAGLGGRPFTLYKFRTMVPDAEARKRELRALSEQDGPAFKLTNDPRVTRVGSFLRQSSIDELPQLWNVLKGEMSLVGPRPLPLDESNACDRWQRHRLSVTPGLTCIWQVRGRSRVSFADWVRMDVAYIRRRTLAHDLWILLRTVPAVLFGKGAR